MRRVNFDIQLLRSFITIVDTGTYVVAAELLNMTQPAMSQQMRRLEEQLGTPMFHREGRKISLTAAGEILLAHARQIIQLNDSIGEELGFDRAREVVNIGMPEHFSESLLPTLIAEAHKAFPHIQLVVKIARSQTLDEGVADGRLHLALLLGPQRADDAAPKEPVPLHWIKSDGFEIDESNNEPVPLVLFRSPCGFRDIATRSLEAAGVKWRCVHEGDDLMTLRAAVLANMGITALPMVRDYAGLATVEGTGKLPTLPNVSFLIRKNPKWKSRSASGLADLAESVWHTFNTAAPDRPPMGEAHMA